MGVLKKNGKMVLNLEAAFQFSLLISNHQILKKEAMNRETGKEKVKQDYSRREFIKVTALTVGVAGALSVSVLATVPVEATGLMQS